MSASITPRRAISSSRPFLRASRSDRLRPGCTRPGLLGSTASAAHSAHERVSGSRPNQRHDAASKPTTLPPNGAFEANRRRTPGLVTDRLRRSASTASTAFSPSVRGRFARASRMTCIVMVLAPLTTSPRRTFVTKARATASGSTPGCRKNLRSSRTTRACTNFAGSSRSAGNRHCPSAAIEAPRRRPPRSRSTVEYGASNSRDGRLNQKPAAIRSVGRNAARTPGPGRRASAPRPSRRPRPPRRPAQNGFFRVLSSHLPGTWALIVGSYMASTLTGGR